MSSCSLTSCAAASHLLLPHHPPAWARDTMGHCHLPLELRVEGRKPGKVKAKRFVSGVTAASCAGGLPNSLPLLLSYRGISVGFKLVLKNSQARGSCLVTLQWKDLPKISCTGSPQLAGHPVCLPTALRGCPYILPHPWHFQQLFPAASSWLQWHCLGTSGCVGTASGGRAAGHGEAVALRLLNWDQLPAGKFSSKGGVSAVAPHHLGAKRSRLTSSPTLRWG